MSVPGMLVGARRRAAEAWAHPVYRSGYLLVGNSVVTAVTGVGFWLLCARLYSPEVVGINSSTISAMMLIAGVAQLNLMSSLLRFVPTAGRRAGALIVPAYLVGATLSVLAAVAFLAGLGVWAPALRPLLLSPAVAVSFVLAAGVWALWVMQGSVLVAVGRAGATTWTNQLFNGLKLVLLAAFFAVLPASGVWYAWVAATAAGLTAGLWFLFRRALPGFGARDAHEPAQVPTLADLARFAGPDYIAALAWIACTSITPILVLDLSDARHAAVFALAWQVCFVLYGVPAALGQALVAHTSRHPDELVEHHRRILLSSLGFLGPVVAVLVLFAPIFLRPFGDWYAGQGVTTLRLLSLSALPNAVVALAVSRARVERRMTTVVTTMTLLCVVVLGITWLLVPRVGIVGGAVAWLAAQVVLAGGVMLLRFPGAPVPSRRVAGPGRRRARPPIAIPGPRRPGEGLGLLVGQPGGIRPRGSPTGPPAGTEQAAETQQQADGGRPANTAAANGHSGIERMGMSGMDVDSTARVRPGPEGTAPPVVPHRRASARGGTVLRAALTALTVAAGLSAALPGAPIPVRAPLVITAALLVPGAALLGVLPARVLRDRTWPAWLGISFGLSCAVHVAGGFAMAATHWWHPEVWLLAVAAASVAGLAFPRTNAWPRLVARRPRPGSVAVLGLLAAGLVLWALSLRHVRTTGLTDLGLPPALPVAWYAALAVTTAAALAAVLFLRSDGLAATAVGAVAVILFGTVPALGGPPQYSWVYKHIGVVQYIEAHHGTLLSGDVYQRWPGFFAAAAAIAPASGHPDPVAFAGWAELVFAVADALLVAALARSLRFRRSSCWGAALLFTVANWIGQTYFSPQALTYTLQLAFFVLLLQHRGPATVRPLLDRALSFVWRHLSGFPDRGRHTGRDAPAAVRAIAPPPSTLALLVLLQACMSVSHQLTPYLLAIGLGLVALAVPIRPRWLWPAVAALPVAYLIPNLGFVQRNFGIFTSFDVFANVQHDQTFETAVTAGKALNALTSQVLSFTVWGAAALALIVGIRARHPAVRVVGPLIVAPFFLVLAQNYGGEASLRVFLFSLPWAALAISGALLGTGRWRWQTCWAALTLAVLALFVPSFYGQAELNLMPQDEVRASATIYGIGRPGGVLMLAAPNFPRAYSGNYDRFGFSAGDDIPSLLETSSFRGRTLGSADDVDAVVSSMQHYAPYGFVVFASSEEEYSAVFRLTPPGQLGALERAVARDPRFTLVLTAPDVRIYALGDAVRAGVPLPVRLPPGG